MFIRTFFLFLNILYKRTWCVCLSKISKMCMNTCITENCNKLQNTTEEEKRSASIVSHTLDGLRTLSTKTHHLSPIRGRPHPPAHWTEPNETATRRDRDRVAPNVDGRARVVVGSKRARATDRPRV